MSNTHLIQAMVTVADELSGKVEIEDCDELELSQAGLWIENALEVRVTRTLGTNDLHSFEVVVTLGGPNIFVKFNGSTATITGYWGSDKETCTVEDILGVYDALEELANI